MFRSRVVQRCCVVSILVVFLVGIGFAIPATAQSLRTDTSLRFAPADASFYVTMLRNREQFERFVQSKAFARLKSLPIVQKAWAQLQDDDEWQEVQAFFAQPENQQLLDVLADAASREIFLMGDERCADWFSALNRLGNSINLAQLQAAASGQRAEEVIQQEMMKVLTENEELLHVPSVMMGLRVSDADAVQRQIDRLEALLKQVMEREAPQLVDRLSRETFAGSQHLTLRLDGSLVPWDKALEDVELSSDDKDRLAERLRQVKMTITIGVWNGYLLIAKGETTESLSALGQGELLADRPEFAPLWKAESRPMTSIGYASKRFIEKLASVDQQIDQMIKMGKAAVPMLPVDSAIQEDLNADLEKIGRQLKDMAPELGAVMAYEYLTDEGYESVRYNWAEQQALNGAHPLTILNHLGGSPIAFFATRSKPQPEMYEFTRTWAAKLVSYLERIGGPMLDEGQRELYDRAKKELSPLLTRMHEANRDKLAPAFADGQFVLLLDAQPTSTKWCNFMQPSEQPLPLPQLAWVYGVSDAELLKQGAAEYRDVLQTAIQKMAELMPDRIPPLPIPAPASREVDHGTIYTYNLPVFLGVDPRLAPNAGVSASVMALTMMPETTEKILKSEPLQGPGPLADLDRPLAIAWHFNMQQLVQVARPWVDYGMKMARQGGSVDEEVVQLVNTLLDVLACFRDASGVSYFEDNALVSHIQMRFQDLEE